MSGRVFIANTVSSWGRERKGAAVVFLLLLKSALRSGVPYPLPLEAKWTCQHRAAPLQSWLQSGLEKRNPYRITPELRFTRVPIKHDFKSKLEPTDDASLI